MEKTDKKRLNKCLNQQLLKFLITNKETINNRNILSKYFTRWRLFVSDNKNYDNIDK